MVSERKRFSWRRGLTAETLKQLRQMDNYYNTIRRGDISEPFKELLLRKVDKLANQVKTFAGF